MKNTHNTLQPIQSHIHIHTNTQTCIHRYAYKTHIRTYAHAAPFTPSFHALGQAGESSMCLLPTLTVKVLLDSLEFFLANRTGQAAFDRLIIPTVRNFLHVFNVPWRSGGLSFRGLLIGYMIDTHMGHFYFKNCSKPMPSKLDQL